MSKESRKRGAQKGLSASVERSIERTPIQLQVQQQEVSTEQLLDFTGAFLDDLSKMPRLEKIDLMSPEKASQAVEMLEARKRFLEQKIKAAASLKEMLQKRGGAGNNYQ